MKRTLSWLAAIALVCGCSGNPETPVAENNRPPTTGTDTQDPGAATNSNRTRPPRNRPDRSGTGGSGKNDRDAGDAVSRPPRRRNGNGGSGANDAETVRPPVANNPPGRNTPPAEPPPEIKLVPAFPGTNAVVGLQRGDMIPEITGEDLEGTEFSLSDYEGKVIMLDFWGHW